MNQIMVLGRPKQKMVSFSLGDLDAPAAVQTSAPRTQRQEMRDWGIEETPLGFDSSALLAALNETSRDETGKHWDRWPSGEGLEVYTLEDGSRQWVHSYHHIKNYIEAHLFDVDVRPNEISASIATKDLARQRATLLTRIDGTPFSRDHHVRHYAPSPQLWWRVGLSNKQTYMSGAFDVVHSDKNELNVERIGARMFEFFRLYWQQAGGPQGINFHLQKGRDTFTIRLSDVCIGGVVAKGFEYNDAVHVRYIGADKNPHYPACQFDNIREAVEKFFPGTRK